MKSRPFGGIQRGNVVGSLADFVGTFADDDRIDLGGMAILRSEAFGHFLDEVVVALFLDEVDGAAAEAATHDTATGYAVLLGDVVEEVELFA